MLRTSLSCFYWMFSPYIPTAFHTGCSEWTWRSFEHFDLCEIVRMFVAGPPSTRWGGKLLDNNILARFIKFSFWRNFGLFGTNPGSFFIQIGCENFFFLVHEVVEWCNKGRFAGASVRLANGKRIGYLWIVGVQWRSRKHSVLRARCMYIEDLPDR